MFFILKTSTYAAPAWIIKKGYPVDLGECPSKYITLRDSVDNQTVYLVPRSQCFVHEITAFKAATLYAQEEENERK